MLFSDNCSPSTLSAIPVNTASLERSSSLSLKPPPNLSLLFNRFNNSIRQNSNDPDNVAKCKFSDIDEIQKMKINDSKIIQYKPKQLFYITNTNWIYSPLWLLICCKTKLKKKNFFENFFVFFTKYTLFGEKIFLYGKKSFILKIFFTKKTPVFLQRKIYIYSFCKKKIFLIIKSIFVKTCSELNNVVNSIVNSIIWSLKLRKHPICGIP